MNGIQRVAIFSGVHRLLHGLIALGMIFELTSAWLIQHSNVDVIAWSDWHAMVGQVLLLLLLLRLGLMFRKDSTHWRLLLPTREQRHVVTQTLKFYASLGRLPCPDWYALNPLWQPLYLLMIGVMLLAALSGFLIGKILMVFGIPMTELHTILSAFVLYFTFIHIVFVIWHDVKGQGGHISAILNGHKYFHVKNSTQSSQPNEQSVSLDSLIKK